VAFWSARVYPEAETRGPASRDVSYVRGAASLTVSAGVTAVDFTGFHFSFSFHSKKKTVPPCLFKTNLRAEYCDVAKKMIFLYIV
jgi:hypothetical protein